jgi:hypothetical protein
VRPDAVVVDFGINDTHNVGTCASVGYACYGAKIDWLLHLLPRVPVFWTNLPCPLERPELRAACSIIDRELNSARKRWSNLTVLDWQAAAVPADMGTGPHYTPVGYAAWASLVARALDGRFPR